MEDERGSRLFLAVMVASMAAHFGFYAYLGTVEFDPKDLFSFEDVSVDLVETPAPEPDEPEPEEPEPEEAPPEPEEPPPPPPKPRTPEPPPEPDEPPPPPAEETPVAFDNITLTNAGDSSWATNASSGQDRAGPIGPPGAPTGRRRDGTLGGTPGAKGSPDTGPRIVAVRDLSRAPRFPPLDDQLRRFYPERARTQGVEGEALIRARIEPTGKISPLGTRSESVEGYDFGSACMRMLRGVRVPPPLDQDGQPVATIINFNCEFLVRY